MLVSFKWLSDYVATGVSPDDLAHRLTMAGLEVEAIYRPESAMAAALCAKVLEILPHPNADRLKLCIVDAGKEKVQVVCGAPNVAEGGLYPIALPGAALPGGEVKRAKIRGETSHGMLLSERDLGLSDDHSGLMVLPDGSDPGASLSDIFGQDTVFEIGVTPNRPDCLSVIGIARESAVLTGKRIAYPDLSLEEKGGPIEDTADVIVHAPELCPRYAARLIKGLRIGPSPGWLAERLKSFDQEPINNVVDVTNYVMMEFGQPLHAFDFNMLAKSRIEVRTAQEGEGFTTLDEKEHELKEGMLLICDGERPVALAGIMGGLNSEIIDETTDVLIESAYFDPVSIRKTSKALGISTESSYRFERGVDPVTTRRALERAAQLMLEVAGGELSVGVIDRVADIPVPREISITVTDASSFLGVELDAKEVEEILTGLGLEVSRKNGGFRVLPPSHRLDLKMAEDIYEEVARIMGYHRIPSVLPGAPQALPERERYALFREEARRAMISMGFFEAVTYSFVSVGSLRDLGLSESDPRLATVRLMNPLTEDQEVMRTTEAVGLLNAVSHNLNRKNEDLRIFELGSVFMPEKGEELPRELEVLGCAMCGLGEMPGWTSHSRALDFYDIKGVAETLAEGLGVPGLVFQPDEIEPFLSPGAACSLYLNGEKVGYLGEVEPGVRESFGVKARVFIFEIYMDALFSARKEPFYRSLPRFPSVSRDLALVLAGSTPASRVTQSLKHALEKVLAGTDVRIGRMEIFDVYTGSQLEENLKSLGVRLSFLGERSLTDEEVNGYVRDALKSVLPSLDARLRE